MISVSNREGLLKVTSPFNREFVSFARMRGGKWSDGQRAWMFDPRDEFAVRSTLIDIFGTDDYESSEKISVRVKLDHFDTDEEFFLFGRQLLRRKYSNNRVEVDNGVLVVEGGFHSKGGSLKNPAVAPKEGTVLEVRDIPRDIAVRTWQEHKEAIELLDDLDIKKLKEEKETLLERIKQIDQIITDLEAKKADDDLADLYD
ncbi:MAG: hypothetical protein PHN69_06765 [Candidatus Pacebacteria bacterium]|nr:hypothetical protein [Candidatus Paceibacterota bacterium]